MNNYNNLPIGVFDSGVGGLTACKTIQKVLSNEDVIYFGDTLNAPYGTRSNEEITALSIEDVKFLLSKNVKAILIACGTITSVCIDELRKITDVPIIGVVNASSIIALNASKSKRICALATPATTKKHAYSNYMKKINPNIETFDLGCPKFVPLIEASKITINDQEMVQAVNEYMSEVQAFNPDTIILGCTHFPLIEPLLKKLYPELIKLSFSNISPK